MKKKIVKKKNVLHIISFSHPLFHKALLAAFLLTMVSIVYVIQVAAQTPQRIPKPESLSGEKKTTLDEHEPIHISTDFNMPFSAEKPLRIIMPDIRVDVAIVHGALIDGHWEVSEVFASHGQGSASPGQIGNMVIFAHARPNLFFNLQNATLHNEVYVLTDKKWYAYKVTDITQVTPEQVEVIAPTTDERITLFTCSGVDDEKRFIVVGKRIETSVLELIRKIY